MMNDKFKEEFKEHMFMVNQKMNFKKMQNHRYIMSCISFRDNLYSNGQEAFSLLSIYYNSQSYKVVKDNERRR